MTMTQTGSTLSHFTSATRRVFSATLGVLSFFMLMLAIGNAQAQQRELTVYTYESFTAEWGPGPAIKAGFEEQCGDCTVNFVALDSSAGILNRVQLEGENTQADIVLGLDTNLMAIAEDTGLLAPSGVDTDALQLPIEWSSDTFVPFDYGYFAFVYDTQALPEPPDSFDALINAPDDVKIIIQDPRTSTPGLGLLLWMKSVYGDQAAEKWEALQPRILTVTKGWSEAYFSLFLNGEAPMVLSAEPAQSAIPLGNVMYPVVDLGESLPEAFSRLITPASTLLISPEDVRDNRKQWINEWLEASSAR